MKLNYRDSMILLGVLSVAIILIGVFLFIKPKIKEIKTDKETLATEQANWDAIQVKLDEIGPLQDAIKEGHAKATQLAGDFVDVSKVDQTFELDQFMQPYVDECQLEASVVDLASTATKTLPYYYFTPSVITSSMFDAADINGNYAANIAESQTESNALSQRTAETVMCTQYGVSAKGTRENIWAFMEKINSLDTTILIDSVAISDYTFNKEAVEKHEPDAEPVSEVTFVVSIYSVFEMDEPVVE